MAKKFKKKLFKLVSNLKFSSEPKSPPLSEDIFDKRRDELQRQILSEDSLDARVKFWNLMKRTQNSDRSWLRFLNEVCSVSYVTVSPEKSSTLYIKDDSGSPVPLHLLLDPGVGLKTLITKEYDPENVEFFYSQATKHQNSPITIIDIGANIGLFSRQCIAKFGNRLEVLYAYEPDPAIFPVLKQNLSKIENVKLINSGIGDKAGELDFFIDTKHPSSSSLLKSSLPEEFYNVNKTTVNVLEANEEAIKWMSHNGVLLYKSDTQGYDLNIAVALGVTFFEKIDAALIEIFPYSDYMDSLLDKFKLIVDLFPNKASLQNPNKLLNTEQTLMEIKSGVGFDLILWR